MIIECLICLKIVTPFTKNIYYLQINKLTTNNTIIIIFIHIFTHLYSTNLTSAYVNLLTPINQFYTLSCLIIMMTYNTYELSYSRKHICITTYNLTYSKDYG